MKGDSVSPLRGHLVGHEPVASLPPRLPPRSPPRRHPSPPVMVAHQQSGAVSHEPTATDHPSPRRPQSPPTTRPKRADSVPPLFDEKSNEAFGPTLTSGAFEPQGTAFHAANGSASLNRSRRKSVNVLDPSAAASSDDDHDNASESDKQQQEQQPTSPRKKKIKYLRVGERAVMNVFEASCFVLDGSSSLRHFCFDIIDHWLFDLVIIILILYNVSYFVVGSLGIAPELVVYSEYVIQGLFAVELLIKVMVMGFIAHPYSYCRHPMRMLELLVVLCGFAAIPLTQIAQGWATLRNLKLMRLFRVMERIMQYVPELRSIFDALAGGLPRLVDALLLVSFLVIALSIVGVQLFRGTFHQRCYFTPPPLDANSNITGVVPVNESYRNRLFVGTVTENWNGDNATGRLVAPFLDPLEPWPCSVDPLGGYSCPRGASCLKNISLFEQLYTNFDHVASAAYVVLKMASIDNNQDEIRRMQYTTGSAAIMFGLVIVFLVTFCAMNFFIAVLSWEYDIACQRHMPDIAEQMLTMNPDALPPWADDPPPSDAFFDVKCCPLLGTVRRGVYRYIVGTAPFFWLAVLVVTCNVAVLAASFDGMTQELTDTFNWINIGCGCFYILEESLKIFCLLQNYFKQKLNLFNGLLSAIVLAELVMTLLNVENGREVFVALHAVYILRLVSLAVKFDSARQLLLTVAGAAKPSLMLFLLLITYVVVSAIFALYLFQDSIAKQHRDSVGNTTSNISYLLPSSSPRPNFDDLPNSIFSLFTILTGESWLDTVASVLRGSSVAGSVFFFAFYFLGTTLILNLFVVIVIAAYNHTANDIAAWKQHEKRRSKLSGTRGEQDSIYVDSSSSSDSEETASSVPRAIASSTGDGSRRGAEEGDEESDGFHDADSVAAAAIRAVDDNNEEAEHEQQHKKLQQHQANETKPPTPTNKNDQAGQEQPEQQQQADHSFDSSQPALDRSFNSQSTAPSMPKLDMKLARWKATAADAKDREEKKLQKQRRKSASPSNPLAAHTATANANEGATTTTTITTIGESPAPAGGEKEETGAAPETSATAGPSSLENTVHNNNTLISPESTARRTPGSGSIGSGTRKVREKQRKTFAIRLAHLMGSEYLTFDSVAGSLEGNSFFIFGPDNCFRQHCAYIASHPLFEFLTLIVVLESLIVLGFEASATTQNVLLGSTADLASQPIAINNLIISSWFVLEMLLRMIGFQVFWQDRTKQRTFFSEPWNVFDFIVVVVTVLSNLVAVNFLKAVRIFRLAAKFGNLRVVLQSLLRAIPGILKVIVLVLAYMFLAAVLGVQLFMGRFATCNDPEITNRSLCTGNFTVERVRWEQVRDHNNDTGSRHGQLRMFHMTATVPRLWQASFFNFDHTGWGLVSALCTFWGNSNWPLMVFDAFDGTDDPETGLMYTAWRTVPFIYFVTVVILGRFFFNNLFIGVLMDLFKREHKFELGYSDKEGNALLTAEQEQWVRNYRFVQATGLPNPPERPHNRFRKICCWIYFEDERMEEVSRMWEMTVSFCVLVNVAFMATEFEGMSEFWSSFLWFENLILTIFFAIEVIVSLFALKPLLFSADANNIFNLLVTVASFVSIGFSGPDINVVRVIRIFHVLRVVRKARGVYRLWSALVYSTPQVINITVLVTLLMYVFGVTATAIFGNAYIDHEDKNEALSVYYNFRNPGLSMLTLVQIATSDNWAKVMKKMAGMNELNSGCSEALDSCGKWYAIPFFIVFMVTAHSVAVNLYIFIIVDNVLEMNRLNDISTQWLLAQLHDFRQLWMGFDRTRRKKIKWQYLVLLIRYMLATERQALRRFRREIGMPIRVFRSTDADALIVESMVNELSADKHSAEGLELQMKVFYQRLRRKERRAQREAEREAEEELRRKQAKALRKLEDEERGVGGGGGGGAGRVLRSPGGSGGKNSGTSSPKRSPIQKQLRPAARQRSTVNSSSSSSSDSDLDADETASDESTDEEERLRRAESKMKKITLRRRSSVASLSGASDSMRSQQKSPPQQQQQQKQQQEEGNRAKTQEETSGAAAKKPEAPRQNIDDDNTWCVTESFLLRRLESLAIPIMPGGFVDYNDCVFGQTRAYSGSTGEMTGNAQMFLSRVREIDYNQTFQLHHAVAAMRILRWLRKCQARRARRLEMAAMDFMLMASEQQQRMDSEDLEGTHGGTSSSDDSSGADHLTALIEQMQRTGALDQLRRMFTKRYGGQLRPTASAAKLSPSPPRSGSRGRQDSSSAAADDHHRLRRRAGSSAIDEMRRTSASGHGGDKRTSIGDVITGRHRRLSNAAAAAALASAENQQHNISGMLSSDSDGQQQQQMLQDAEREFILRNFLAFDNPDYHHQLQQQQQPKAEVADSNAGTDPLPLHLRAALGQTISLEASRAAAEATRKRIDDERVQREKEREAVRRAVEIGVAPPASSSSSVRNVTPSNRRASSSNSNEKKPTTATTNTKGISAMTSTEPFSMSDVVPLRNGDPLNDDPFERYGVDPLVPASKFPAGKYDYYKGIGAATTTTTVHGDGNAPGSQAASAQRGDLTAGAPSASTTPVSGAAPTRLALGMPVLDKKPIAAPGEFHYKVAHLFPPNHPLARREQLDKEAEARNKRQQQQQQPAGIDSVSSSSRNRRGISPTLVADDGGERASAHRTTDDDTAASRRTATNTSPVHIRLQPPFLLSSSKTGAVVGSGGGLVNDDDNDDDATTDTVRFVEVFPSRAEQQQQQKKMPTKQPTAPHERATPFSLSSPLPLQLARCTSKFDASMLPKYNQLQQQTQHRSRSNDDVDTNDDDQTVVSHDGVAPVTSAQVLAVAPGQLLHVLDVVVGGTMHGWAFCSRITKPDEKGFVPLDCLNDAISGASVVGSAKLSPSSFNAARKQSAESKQQQQPQRPSEVITSAAEYATALRRAAQQKRRDPLEDDFLDDEDNNNNNKNKRSKKSLASSNHQPTSVSASSARPRLPLAQLLYDFLAEHELELSCAAGEVVELASDGKASFGWTRVLRLQQPGGGSSSAPDGGLSFAETAVSGLVPTNFLQPLSSGSSNEKGASPPRVVMMQRPLPDTPLRTAPAPPTTTTTTTTNATRAEEQQQQQQQPPQFRYSSVGGPFMSALADIQQHQYHSPPESIGAARSINFSSASPVASDPMQRRSQHQQPQQQQHQFNNKGAAALAQEAASIAQRVGEEEKQALSLTQSSQARDQAQQRLEDLKRRLKDKR